MLIKRLILKKLLSFNESTIELGPLNVLIGPNAVGKSNLIEVIALLQAAPSSLDAALRNGGGVHQFIWLGERAAFPVASIECELTAPPGRQTGNLNYHLEFSEEHAGFTILSESLTNSASKGSSDYRSYFSRSKLEAEFTTDVQSDSQTSYRASDLMQGGRHPVIVPTSESLFSQFKNPADPTPITAVGQSFSQIRIYREFKTGRGSQARYGISTNAPKASLQDGSDNLALVLQDLNFLDAHGPIQIYLQRFCDRFEDVKIDIGEGLARTFLRERGLTELLSASRMSDGTLKFLSLLAALFHPKRPALMCIEEPELGLHPDALQLIAEALVEASESMQLIVTTHSEALVDALSDRPESVLVCERDPQNGTQMKRLEKEQLRDWLQHYTLGQLWRKGEIGGGRW